MSGPEGDRRNAAELLERTRTALAGDYEIVREIGRGGTAIVFLARDLRQARDVAIKVLRPELAAIVGGDRFRREIDIAASLSHPHILPLHDSGEADELLYYVTPYIEGETLSARLERDGRLPLEDAIRIATEVAQGLDYAHRRGIIHRDVKPANILLSDGHAVIADFGIARVRDALALHTADGYALGTPAYMSPEQASGGDVDGRTDVYALGCVLYEMLSGDAPFTSRNAHAVIVERFGQRTPTLTPVRRDVPNVVVMALKRALAFDRDDRFATAAEFAAAIAPRVDPTFRHIAGERWARTPMPHRVAALVVVLLLSALAATTFRGDDAVDPRPSYLIVAQTTLASSLADDSVSQEASASLRRLLGVWRQVRTVPDVALAGLMFDAGVSSGTRRSLEELYRLASATGVRTLVTVSADVTDGSLYIEANVLDVRSRKPAREPIRVEGDRTALSDLVQSIAATLLEFSGTPQDLSQLARESTDFDAIQDLQEGITAFEQWELETAEARFRSAIERDTALARGHYYLALTLYWIGAGQVHRLPELGPEVRRHALMARRLGDPVPYRDSLRIVAFASFTDGDYAGARLRYDELIDADSTDTYAWLGLGMVEYQDRLAVQQSDGSLRPRGSYNAAVRAFRETVRLSPEFAVGYGHLFEIEQALARSPGACVLRAFLRPGSRPELFWENVPQDSMIFFCPVHTDSVHWLPRDALGEMDSAEVARGRNRFAARLDVELNRWANFAVRSPRPRDFRARRLLWQRTWIDPAEPAMADSLALAALRSHEEALSLSRDTVPEQWIRLGSLLLAVGREGEALAATERGIASLEDEDRYVLPREALNIFLALGRLERGLEVALLVREEGGRYTDSDMPRLRWPDEELYRVGLMGALGIDDVRLVEGFADIERAWTRQEYPEAARLALRSQLTPVVAHALVIDDSIRDEWFDGLAGVDAWRRLLVDPIDPDGARALLDGPELHESGVARYIAAVRLSRAGFAEAAISHLDAFLRWPLWIDTFDPRWGLRPLALLERARAKQGANDVNGAEADYTAFVDAWEQPDPALRSKTIEARRALDDIRGVPRPIQ